MPNLSDDELLDALGVDQEIARTRSHSPREERIIAGFEDISSGVVLIDSKDMADVPANVRPMFETSAFTSLFEVHADADAAMLAHR